MSSEKILEYEDRITIRVDEYDFEGHCIITNYRMIFKPHENYLRQCVKNPFPNFPDDYLKIPLYLITKIEKSVDKKNPNNYVLEITTKDSRFIKLVNSNSSKKFYGELAGFVSLRHVDEYMSYAVAYREHHPVNNDGWSMYDLISEFKRQGLDLCEENNSNYPNPNNNSNNMISVNLNVNLKSSSKYTRKMRLSFVNERFDLCMSYPEIIIVPSIITNDELREIATFRTKGRIPNMCYYNSENNSSIWRSSQTKSGLTYQRNEKDEKLLNAIFEAGNSGYLGKDNSGDVNNINNNSVKRQNKLIIYDARPYLNALANRFKGAGFENTDYYKNAEISFCEIDNIHCVRTALQKINMLITNTKQPLYENKTFFTNLESSTWLQFIYQIIKSSVDIATSVRSGYSVLIHCSDGWDRSSQLTSLSQLLIDPYYRTIEGFIVLIEKEWLSFGHQFGLRNGFYNLKSHSEDQRAPIFLQWLDCIHQLVYHFPHLFEFNIDMLLFIAMHINTCKYGTFLFNSEYERKDKRAKEKTVSVWTDILENRSIFVNPFYKLETLNDKSYKYLLPNLAFYKIRFWEEYFLRYNIYGNRTSKFFGKLNCENTSISNIEGKKSTMVSIKENVRGDLYSKTTKNRSNLQFIESEKINDAKIIKNQREEIEKLQKIVKEISSKIIFKVEDYKQLPEDVKSYMKELNDKEIVEEEGFVLVRDSVMK